jgi:hypothetical protein
MIVGTDAVGGACWVSPDGITWTQITISAALIPVSVATDNGELFVFRSATPTARLYYSTNRGVTWNRGTPIGNGGGCNRIELAEKRLWTLDANKNLVSTIAMP